MVVKAGYSKTELGLIPSDWRIDSIKNIASITTGDKNTQDRVADGMYPFFVRSQTIERINSYSFDGEAVLTAGDGVGTGKVFHYINGRFDYHQRVYKISDFNEEVDGYFFYLFFSNNFLQRIMSMTAKSSVDSVRMEMIADMKIPLPTLTEQRAIATALSDVDRLLTAYDQLIAKKKAIKQGAMQELLTGRRRLEGFEGENGFEHTELGPIPKDWNIWSLKECLETPPRYGINAPAVSFSENLPQYLRITDISDSGQYIKEGKVSVNHLDSSSYLLSEGDLVLARTGASVGKSYLYNQSDGVLVYAGFLIKIRPDQSKLLPSYLKSYLGTDNYWNWVSIMSVRSGQPGINGAEYGELKIPLPPTIHEQRAIAQILTDMDAEIAALEQQREKYKAVKAGMMQELLTGKTRLV